jgi:hypothetical protein
MTTQFFKTYDQVGKKEDVSDVITNISPTTTPFQTLIKNERTTNTVFQWQEDELASVGDNSAVEGADATLSDMVPTVMRSNYTQILQKTIKVSGTADAVSTYGRAKETAYQLAKKSAELKREFEYHLVGKAQSAAAGDSSTARTFGNAFGNDAAGTAMISSAVTVTTDSDGGSAGNQAGPLTEANILAVNQKLYEAGAEATYIMVKPADSLIIAGFDKSAGRYREINDTNKTIVNVIDLYVSPFGEQKVLINRFQKATECLVFDPAMWSIVTLRPYTRELLAKTGDADKHQIVGEFSLKHRNYKATGRITNLTGSNATLP